MVKKFLLFSRQEVNGTSKASEMLRTVLSEPARPGRQSPSHCYGTW